ncbi:MAG: MAPEG family protein [Luteimonas sp.]
MAIAYWCILIAALLPYVWVTVAKTSGERYNNRDPRGWLARQENPRSQRANAAQLNAYEAFAPFAASVLMAQVAGVDPARIALLAVAFAVLRVLHGVFYVANQHALRSLVWFGGYGCVVLLMLQAALKVAGIP